VNLTTLTGNVNRAEINKTKVMDETLKTILASDVSSATREALLKQMDQETVVSLPGPRSQEPSRDQMGPPPPQMDRQMDRPMDGQPAPPGGFQGGPQQQQRPRVEARINDPVTKVVGLILGTPEFQRQ